MQENSERDISRTPPVAVMRKLRKEVGFGCPVAGCRLPFLSWHHFDPPWSKRHHHDPDGMVALCVGHHKAADAGLFDDDQLREYKTSNLASSDVEARFEWAKRKQLIRIGGFYTTPTGTRMLNDLKYMPVLSCDEGDEGLLEFSFTLETQRRLKLAEMMNNMFQASPPQLFDIQVDPGGSKIKIWVAKSDLILDIRSRPMKLDDLEKKVDEDFQAWIKFLDASAKKNSRFRTNLELYDPNDPLHPFGKNVGGQTDILSGGHLLPTQAERTGAWNAYY